MTTVALILSLLWILSLWLLLVGRRRPGGLARLPFLPLSSGTLLFFVLCVASLLLLRLLFAS